MQEEPRDTTREVIPSKEGKPVHGYEYHEWVKNSTAILQTCRDVEQKALRYNEGKLKWSLVHYPSIEPLVEVLMFGAEKYSPNNWKKGLDREEILESTMRHLTALFNGEEVDPESGLPHIGHIQCNAMFYQYHHGSNE